MHAQASIDVIDERVRQLEEEEWDYTHDDQYTDGQLAAAATCYIIGTGVKDGNKYYDVPNKWPWDADDWKPRSYRENLVRASALLIAEIERLDRAANVKRT